MSDRTLIRAWLFAAVLLLLGAGIAGAWRGRLALGVLSGGLWNLASLWCLLRLLRAWLGRSSSRPWQVAGWLLMKFPLLYLLVFSMWRAPAIALIGFGVGFTIVLTAVVGALACETRPLMAGRSHVR